MAFSYTNSRNDQSGGFLTVDAANNQGGGGSLEPLSMLLDKTNNSTDTSGGGKPVEIVPPPNPPIGSIWMGYHPPVVGMNMLMPDPNLLSYSMMTAPLLTHNDNTLYVGAAPTKDHIQCKSCTLIPPNPQAPPPTTRDRPPGCRTIFVGGLPDNCTDDMLMEVFQRCGEIVTLRLSKKNFCHIRFAHEHCVDAAISLSGYRMRINGASIADSVRIHVDFAQARDDQYEWECRQRQLQRELRHRERLEEERLRPPSPPPIVHYTEHEAGAILERLKQEDTFTKALLVVITWLERGDCNKRNANTFYSLIQSTNSHVRRLTHEKTQYEDDFRKARDLIGSRMQGILLQFSQIERLFMAACHKKVWDHFTKAQRKNLDTWKKQATEMRHLQTSNVTTGIIRKSTIQSNEADDEMDVSDDDNDYNSSVNRKRQRLSNSIDDSLKDVNENLKCQVEAYKNEMEVLRADFKMTLEARDDQIRVLEEQLLLMRDNLPTDGLDAENLTQRDARLISVLGAFLIVHPQGAGLDYIWSYVNKLEADLRPSDIEALLIRFPNVFRQELNGIGANIERRWLFNSFDKT